MSDTVLPSCCRLLVLTCLLPAAAWAAPVAFTVRPGPPQSVHFSASTQTEHYGGDTDQVTGQIRVDWAHPTVAPQGRFVVRLSALSTGNGLRDSNMRSRFLETDKYPTATFTLTQLQAPPGPVASGQTVQGVASGTFTLHGVTRPITPAVMVTRGRGANGSQTLHLVAHFVVRLADYKIATPRFLFFSVRQSHAVTVDLLATAP